MLIHGVGFGPATLAPVVRALERRVPVRVMARRGYGERARLAVAGTVAEHVEDLVGELDRHGIERAVLAGMSGGATVVLAATLSSPERVITAIAHEPAVGSIAPELRTAITASLRAGGGVGLMRLLAGERTWGRLEPAAVRALDRASELIEADARAFMAFEPSLPPSGDPIALVCSLGERSGAIRRRVAERLAQLTAAPVVTVRDCGHLPQLDAPDRFAELILTHATTTEPRRPAP